MSDEGSGHPEIHDHVLELIGDTPLVRLHSLAPNGGAQLVAKIEYFNPGGSVKDRIAVAMIEAAERDGSLKPGGTIVEPTSGNTGVGLAIAGQQRGYKCIFICPDKVSEDKIATSFSPPAKQTVTQLPQPRTRTFWALPSIPRISARGFCSPVIILCYLSFHLCALT